MKKRPLTTPEAAESLAIQALTFIAADAERLGRFLAITGIGPEGIRAAAEEPLFLMGVLDYIAADQELLAAFAGEAGIEAAAIRQARESLGGPLWEREVP